MGVRAKLLTITLPLIAAAILAVTVVCYQIAKQNLMEAQIDQCSQVVNSLNEELSVWISDRDSICTMLSETGVFICASEDLSHQANQLRILVRKFELQEGQVEAASANAQIHEKPARPALPAPTRHGDWG